MLYYIYMYDLRLHTTSIFGINGGSQVIDPLKTRNPRQTTLFQRIERIKDRYNKCKEVQVENSQRLSTSWCTHIKALVITSA